jgi:hypothetical protein
MRRDQREIQRRHHRPELGAAEHGLRHGLGDTVEDDGWWVAGEEGLHAEEIGVEEWCEDELLD